VQQAYVNNPQIEQAVLNMKNNEITIKAEKNGLLPTVDAYAFYGASCRTGGSQSPYLISRWERLRIRPGTYPTVGYGTALGICSTARLRTRALAVNITIPLRNRVAQADQARSQMEYRQAQMRLQQLYTQIRIQVINAQYALTNDRAQVSGGAGRARVCGAVAGRRAEEVQAGSFDVGAGAAAAEESGERRRTR
jgi:outer membrane protein